MKFFHIADLHLGKMLHQHNLLPDQKHYLDFVLKKIDEEKPDVLIIAGDVYDRSIPSAETIKLFDYFITALSQKNCQTLIIAGNHDSPERLSFANQILRKFKIKIVTEFTGELEKFTFQNHFHFYLLPFFKASQVRQFFPKQKIENYEDAIRLIMQKVDFSQKGKHILIAHQFFVNNAGQAVLSDSERTHVGGIEAIGVSNVLNFDYVALGHLHTPHYVQAEKIRYSGSPLYYSASELSTKKYLTCIEMQTDKPDFELHKIPYEPLHQTRNISGMFQTLIEKAAQQPCRDYFYIELQDEFLIEDVINRFRRFYPNVLEIRMPRIKHESNMEHYHLQGSPENLSALQLFQIFYQAETEKEMTKRELNLIEDVINGHPL